MDFMIICIKNCRGKSLVLGMDMLQIQAVVFMLCRYGVTQRSTEDRIYLNNENKVIVDKEELKKYNDADKQNEKVDETFNISIVFTSISEQRLKMERLKLL